MARHCIGLNHVAIGIENVGDGEKLPLTPAQVQADAALVRATARWMDACPLGTAAGYGVNLPLDRQGVSDELGFARLLVNPVYAQNSRGKLELAALGVMSSREQAPGEWQVPATALPRLRVVGRLMRDLGVNVSGAALALQLLEAQRALEVRLRHLERLVGDY